MLHADGTYGAFWNPLEHDAQAMGLVKLLGLDCVRSAGCWSVYRADSPDKRVSSSDLNRAICEYVAKMRAAQSTSSAPAQKAWGWSLRR